MEKAIEKLKSEMDKNKGNSYVQVVGNFLLQYLNDNPSAAEKILKEDKTISKSLNEMRKAAEKIKVNNCGVLADQEAFAIVLKYFDLDTKVPEKPVEIPKATKEEQTDFNYSLDDFLK